MSSHPTPAPEPDARITAATCWFFVVAGVVAATLAILAGFDLASRFELPRGVSGFLSAVTAIAGIGAIVRIAADAVLHRLDRLEQRLDELGEQGYATGYVDGAAGGRHLTAVNQR